MNTRDKLIIADLEKFRVLSREHIATLHFNNCKNKVNECNRVMLRLTRENKVSVSKERRMYNYFPSKHIKKDSSKLNHYLAIADLYVKLMQFDKPRRYDVEPKLNFINGPEPDVFAIWHNKLFFIEIQLSDYSKKQWQEKMNRYEMYFLSEAWKGLDWQPQDKKLFPTVWIVGKGGGMIPGNSFRCIHATVEEMVEKLRR